MRPEIICHMISSLDGRLRIERYSKLYNTENENLALEVYLDLEKQFDSDARIIGKGTVRSMGLTEVFEPKTISLAEDLSPFFAEKSSENFCVIFDSKGEIRFPGNKFEGDNIIVVLGESVTEDYLRFSREAGISYLFAGNDGHDLDFAMSTLYATFGIRRAYLEGGGILNGSFLKRKLIDEVSILLYPGIDGAAGMPSIFDYKGHENDPPSNGQYFTLKHLERLDSDLIWLRYDVHRD